MLASESCALDGAEAESAEVEGSPADDEDGSKELVAERRG